jgi:hypothetical protein
MVFGLRVLKMDDFYDDGSLGTRRLRAGGLHSPVVAFSTLIYLSYLNTNPVPKTRRHMAAKLLSGLCSATRNPLAKNGRREQIHAPTRRRLSCRKARKISG